MTRPEDSLRTAGLAFLFKKDRGEISRGLWIKGALAIVAPLIPLYGVWRLLAPHATRAVSRPDLVDVFTVVAYFYLAAFSILGMIAAICFYNLSAKRFRTRGWPPSLAGLALIAALISMAASALQPESEGAISILFVRAALVVTGLLFLWTVYELGVAPDRRREP